MSANQLLWMDVPGVSHRLFVPAIEAVVVKPYSKTATVIMRNGSTVEIKRELDSGAECVATEINLWIDRMKRLFPEEFAINRGGAA